MFSFKFNCYLVCVLLTLFSLPIEGQYVGGGMGYYPYPYMGGGGGGMYGGSGCRGGYSMPCYYQPYPMYGGGGGYPCYTSVCCSCGGGGGGGGVGNMGIGMTGYPYYGGGYPYYGNSMSKFHLVIVTKIIPFMYFCVI